MALRQMVSAMSQELQKLLEDVRRDIGAAEAKVSMLRQVEEYLASKLKGQTLSENAREGQPAANGAEHGLTQSEAAEKVLKEHGHPLSTNDLVEEIVRRGLYPERSDRKQLVNSIYSAMRRDADKFVKTGRGIWALVEWGGR
jgi:YesN/AraC family two-component response regulator